MAAGPGYEARARIKEDHGPTRVRRRVIIDVGRRITFAYVMNKMAPVGPIAAALAERVSDVVKR
jgi:hypothetical protein